MRQLENLLQVKQRGTSSIMAGPYAVAVEEYNNAGLVDVFLAKGGTRGCHEHALQANGNGNFLKIDKELSTRLARSSCEIGWTVT